MVVAGGKRVVQLVPVFVTHPGCLVVIGDASFHAAETSRLSVKEKQFSTWYEKPFVVERIVGIIILTHQYPVYMVVDTVAASKTDAGIEGVLLGTQ